MNRHDFISNEKIDRPVMISEGQHWKYKEEINIPASNDVGRALDSVLKTKGVIVRGATSDEIFMTIKGSVRVHSLKRDKFLQYYRFVA